MEDYFCYFGFLPFYNFWKNEKIIQTKEYILKEWVNPTPRVEEKPEIIESKAEPKAVLSKRRKKKKNASNTQAAELLK